MDSQQNEDVQLSEENFRNVCRLCLRDDEEFISVFDRIDQNPSKRPLPERIYDLYQIKVSSDRQSFDNKQNQSAELKSNIFTLQLSKEDGLPTNICHRCLYNTELFSEFREGVHHCERKLQDFVLSLAGRSTDAPRPQWHLDDIMHDQQESSEFCMNNVVVIDPLKCYESSEGDSSGDEDDSPQAVEQHSGISHTQTDQLQSNNNRQTAEPRRSLYFTQTKPLRNVCFCKYCEAAFAHRKDCEAHELSKHDPIMPHVCNFCPYRCDNAVDFIAHVRLHDPERPYFCTQCNKNFGRRADLRKHGVSHTGIRPFACPVCGKAFSRKTNVTNHMKVHESKQPAQTMPSAPTQFDQSYPYGGFVPAYPPYQDQGYQVEQYSPTKNAVYSKCTIKSDAHSIPKLKIKLTKPAPAAGAASDLRQFPCLTCKKAFKTKRDLARHTQTHSGIKFQCSVCPKGFARRDKLVRHEKIHKKSKTAALPESAFLLENLKRGSHYSAENKQRSINEQPYQEVYRPQFYAEYDLSENNR